MQHNSEVTATLQLEATLRLQMERTVLIPWENSIVLNQIYNYKYSS